MPPSLEELLTRTPLSDTDPYYNGYSVGGLPVCGSDDSARDDRRRVLVSPTNPAVYFPVSRDVSATSTFLNLDDATYRRILTATGGFIYNRTATGAGGRQIPLGLGMAHLCRSETNNAGRYEVFITDNSIVNNAPSQPAALRRVNFEFNFDEIRAIVNSGILSNEHWRVDPTDHRHLDIYPEDTEVTRLIALIQQPNSPITANRRAPMLAAFQQFQRDMQHQSMDMQREMRSEMRWQMIGMTVVTLLGGLYTGLAITGKAGPIHKTVGYPFRGLYNLLASPFDRGSGLSRWWQDISGDFRQLFASRHLKVLDNMTVDATANARAYQENYSRAYTSALEDIRRTHPGMSEQDQADRARGAARNGLRGQFPDYVAAEEVLHSIELGLRSTNAEERASAQSRLDRIVQAENTLVQDKNANPVFVDVKGSGKSISMYAIVLRSIRGESAVPADTIQRRNWRELSRRGLMGTGEGDSAKYVGNLEQNVQSLVDALDYFHGEGQPTTLMIDEIHSFFGDKGVDPHFMKALQIIKGRMAKDNVIAALGATTPEEWAEVTTDKAMADRLRPIRFPATNAATIRLAVRARLLTINPDALSRSDISTTINRLIESSFQLEGEHSPRRVLDIALPAIVSQGDLTPEGVDRYFRTEKELRINEIVRSVVGRFEPVALNARLMNELQSGEAPAAIPEAQLRQQVVSAVMETCREKGWSALLQAEGTRMVREALTQTNAILGSPNPTPRVVTPPPAPRPVVTNAPAADPATNAAVPAANPLAEVMTYPVNDAAIESALRRTDPALADYYRNSISNAATPVTTFGELARNIVAIDSAILSQANQALAAEGLSLAQAPERFIFEVVTRAAAASGGWTPSNPTELPARMAAFETEVRRDRGVERRAADPADAARREAEERERREAEARRGRP